MGTGSGQGYAVIFDMDGVLVDSYDAHFQSWRGLLDARGKNLTDDEFKSTFGIVAKDVLTKWFGEGAFTDEEVHKVAEEKEAAYREIIEANFPAMDGAKELIAALHAAGFGVGIGSSGPPENVQMTIDKLEANAHVSAMSTAKDVTRGKPDPQVFLIAAQKLGIDPAKCAVVEDAPFGVQAADAAGMLSIGLVNRVGHTAEALSAAAHRVHSLRELTPEKIRAWIDARRA